MPVPILPVRAGHQARRRSQTSRLADPTDRSTHTPGPNVELERGPVGAQNEDGFQDTIKEPIDDEPPGASADQTSALPRLYTVQEAASFFARTARTLRTWVGRGHLHPVRIGRSVFVTEAELLRVINAGAEPPDGPGGPADQYPKGSTTSTDFGKTAPS